MAMGFALGILYKPKNLKHAPFFITTWINLCVQAKFLSTVAPETSCQWWGKWQWTPSGQWAGWNHSEQKNLQCTT
jgi:hypothetical protein